MPTRRKGWWRRGFVLSIWVDANACRGKAKYPPGTRVVVWKRLWVVCAICGNFGRPFRTVDERRSRMCWGCCGRGEGGDNGVFEGRLTVWRERARRRADKRKA